MKSFRRTIVRRNDFIFCSNEEDGNFFYKSISIRNRIRKAVLICQNDEEHSSKHAR